VSTALRNVGALTLFVEDLPRSKAFYEQTFDLVAVYEDANSAVFDVGNTLVNLLAVGAAHGLIEPAHVAAPGARFVLSIWVDDTDAVCETLATRGVALLNGPIDRPWGKRTASFADPDGNIWEVAQDLP
jgi:catechol 2,3-dioxygenase-like lactoylglutathione lyase family enzyme